MAIALSPQTYTRFRGIREFNGVNTAPELSAIICENVQLVQTEIGSDTGIKTMDGNAVLKELPSDFKIIGIFKSIQDDITHIMVYVENTEKGVLYEINTLNELNLLVDNLTVTGNCNGITMTSTAYDVFVFTNGEEVKTVCFTSDPAYGDSVKTINAVDYQNRQIKWLSMTEWNGFLVVASPYGVHASHQNDIYTWNDNPEDVADSFYIDFSKKVTAVFAYTAGLYIFTDEDISFLNTTPNDTINSILVTAAGVGCYNFQSIVKHDTYLFFYDNNQKNIYYLENIDNGQIRPSGPVAKEIQSHFKKIQKFKMYSCIYNNRNEIWCLINDNIMIYDYFQSEWVQRQEQKLNTVCLIGNNIYSGGDLGKIYVENINLTFDDKFYPAVYQTSFINFGSNTNLKKQKTPILLVLNDGYTNDFWIQLTVDNKTKSAKRVKITNNAGGRYALLSEDNPIVPDNMKYGTAKYSAINPYSKKVKEISTPQTWYTLGIKIFTTELGQGFYINSIEIKNTKAKLKTKGR